MSHCLNLKPHFYYSLLHRGDKLGQLEVGETSVFDEQAAMEPKKKGRFLVMEQVSGVRVCVCDSKAVCDRLHSQSLSEADLL